jgi:hypothetical protein
MSTDVNSSDVVEDDRITPQHRRNCRRHGVVAVNLSTGLHMCQTCDYGWFVGQRPRVEGGGYYPGWWRCPNGCNVVD